MESAKAYSERHALKWLLQAFDVQDLFPSGEEVGKEVRRGDNSSGGKGKETKDVLSIGTAPPKSLSALCAEALAAQSISDTAPEQDERMFGDLTNRPLSNAGGTATTVLSTSSTVERNVLLLELCTALAHHYASLTTGTRMIRSAHWPSTRSENTHGRRSSGNSSTTGMPRDGMDAAPLLYENLSQALAITKTWVSAAAPLWQALCTQGADKAAAGRGQPVKKEDTDAVEASRPVDAVSAAAAAQAVVDSFFTALFCTHGTAATVPPELRPTKKEMRAAAEIALVFANGHPPQLPRHVWASFLELGREVTRLKGNAVLPTSFKRLSCEAVAMRCLITVLCDGAVTPVTRSLGKSKDMESSLGGSTRSSAGMALPPPRVMDEVVANAALLSKKGCCGKGHEPLPARVAVVFSDSFFMHVLKPYPSLVANFMLAGKR